MLYNCQLSKGERKVILQYHLSTVTRGPLVWARWIRFIAQESKAFERDPSDRHHLGVEPLMVRAVNELGRDARQVNVAH